MAIYKNKKILALFLLPAVILVVFLIFLPVLLNIYYSFLNGQPTQKQWILSG